MNLLVVFVLTAAAGLLLTWFAMKFNILDEPNYRKIHSKAIPKAGGLGFVIPIILVLSWYVIRIQEVNFNSKYTVIIIVTLLLMITGLIDDKDELSARRKLLIQVLAAVITTSAGISFYLIDNFYINFLVSVIWIVGFINSMNLIDGLDGLAGGIGFIASLGILYFAFQYSDTGTAVTAVALMGSLMGFLHWNLHPAKIFMGDTGSLPLGYIMAVLIIFSANSIGGFGGAAIAFFLVAVPVYDTLLSIARRKRNGRPVFSADRSHFYNLLMDKKGLSHRNTVYAIYIFNLFLVAAALLLDHVMPIYRYIISISLVLAAALGSFKAGLLTVDNENGGDK